MKSAIEDLFFGEIQSSMSNHDENPRIKKAERILCENEDVLLKLLGGKEKKLFVELVNAQGEVDGNRVVEHFICGFKLGARIIIESIVMGS